MDQSPRPFSLPRRGPSGLEQDRDRPVVHEGDPHVGAEDAGRDRHAGGAERRHKGLVQLFGLSRRRRAR